MKILDPNLKDGVHEWRDGKRFVKEGDKLYLEGTTTLAGRYFLGFSLVLGTSFPRLVSSPWTNASETLPNLLVVPCLRLSSVLHIILPSLFVPTSSGVAD